ncbi:MAG TPA: hypothetical protein VG742_13815 [Dongiaceae bacterium]|nr:hypothetical protein [Dongiaceae bacterium]
MTRVLVAVLVGACLEYHPRPALADPIDSVSSGELVDLLNYVEVVAERGTTPEPDLPLSIRLFRLSELGECDGTPQSCPTQRMYIAVSEWGEYPDRKLYQLPNAHQWQFVEWIANPQSDGEDDHYIFILNKEVVAADISKEWWSTERYKVSANTHGATLERLP